MKLKYFFITAIFIFIMETVINFILLHYLSLINILFYLLEAITVSAFINIIAAMAKGKTRKGILIFFISLITAFFIGQYVHFHFYDCFFSIYSLVNGGQVFGFISSIIKVTMTNIFGFLLMITLLIIYIFVILKQKDEKSDHTLLILLITLITTIGLSNIKTDQFYSRKDLIKNTNSEVKSVQSFGLIPTMSIDLYKYIKGQNTKLILNEKGYEYKKDDNKKYNVLDTKFNENKEFKDLSNYLKNTNPTEKNEYTGIFKNKNLIFITGESFSFNAIDKDLTPTLYKLYNEGFKFNNFYTPIYYASTSDGEYTNLTGLLPKEGTWSLLESETKTFPYSYGNIFKNNHYQTNSYHNGIYNFYKRDTVMPNLGYNFKACGLGLEKLINCNIFPQSDLEMLNQTYRDYKYSDRFHVYYMSISNHLPYSFKNNDIAKKYENEVEKLKYSKNVKAYMAGTIEVDKALESLIKNLEKSKKLDNTVIVIVPDHFPYGLSPKELKEFINIKEEYNKHKSGLIIYNSKTKGKEINKYASNIDILPTLLNMFGINYDSRLIIGQDIMSKSDGIVIFNDRSFLTDKGYYNEKTNKFTNITKDKTDEKYIQEKRKEVFNKTNASSLILEKDYYKYIK